MDKAFKGRNALWMAISIISLLCALGLLFLMLQEKSGRIETEEKLSETERTKRAVEIKLDHTRLELIQVKDKTKLLKTQLEQEKRSYQSILLKIEKKDSQIKELESNLASEKEQRTSLTNTLAQLRENYDNLKEELREAKQRVDKFKYRLGKFTGKAGVELEKIVVRPKKELSGKILVVNREFHFVVVDLGRKDNVKVGDEFLVYQGSQEIGRVQIEKMYDAMSTASILSGSQEQKINDECIVKSF